YFRRFLAHGITMGRRTVENLPSAQPAFRLDRQSLTGSWPKTREEHPMAQEITNDQANGQASQPQLVMQKIYVKDVSFEAPNAPQIFQEIDETAQPQVQLNLGQKATDLGNDLYEVVLSLTLTCTVG